MLGAVHRGSSTGRAPRSCGRKSFVHGALHASTLQGRPLTLMGSGARSHRSFAAMMHMVHYGGRRGVVDHTFELAEATKAHGVIATDDFFGKLMWRGP